MEKNKYEDMNELEKQVFNLKKSHEKIIEELRIVRKIREKNNNLSPIEDIALRRYEDNLRHEYVRILSVAKEFEEEFNVKNLKADLEKMSFENNVEIEKEPIDEEKEFLEKVIAKYKKEEEYEQELAKKRQQNNEDFYDEIGLTNSKKHL